MTETGTMLPPDAQLALEVEDERRQRVDGPDKGPLAWVKANLFSSVGNTIQTVLFVLVLGGIVRWVLGLAFEETIRWSSVWTNMRLLMAYNYPAEQFIRVWFSAGVILVAAALSMAAWGLAPRLTIRRLAHNLIGLGVLLLGMTILAPAEPKARTILAVCGLVPAVVGLAMLGARRGKVEHQISIPPIVTVTGFVAVLLSLIWVAPFGRYLFVDNAPVYEPGTLSMSTKQPLTIVLGLFLLVYAAASAFLGGHRLLQLGMSAFWVAGPAFIIFLVLRDPAFDWDHVLSTDVPMGVGFAVGGAALLYALAEPRRAELARAVGAVLLAFAALHWIAAFFGWYPMLQKARLSFLFLALFTLAVPTFAGERAARLRLAGAWAGFMVLFHWLVTGINTASTVDVSGPFLGGFVFTVSLAYYVMLASFPIGLLMALARTSEMPIFRVLSTGYIEFIRGIPLITVLFFFSQMVPLFLPPGMELAELGAIFIGYTLFSGAYMAENIRGGLQSIRRGQFEAADALGLTTAQRTIFIILPQALRVSIPNLVGQAIATFKETSLVAIVGGFELLRIADKSIPNQPDFLGQKRAALLFISAVYWVVAYSMSRASRNLETKLGVGTR